MQPQDYFKSTAGKPVLTKKGYWSFIPNPLPPTLNWSLDLVSRLAEAERELAKLSAISSNFPFPQLLLQTFIRNEAVLSSRIEGTHASLNDVFRFEAKQLSFFETTDDVKEVLNYAKALEYGMERLKTLPISLRLIRELHRKLTHAVRGGMLTPGEFRASQNWIGPAGSTLETALFVPPPVEEMHQSLGELEKFIHANSELPAIIRVALIHYQFEAIHPFLDGNGRVGRLLMLLLFCEWKLLPLPILNLSIYIERYRQTYYDLLLKVSKSGEWEAWIKFFLTGVSEQSQHTVISLHQLQLLRNQYQSIIDMDRNPTRMGAVIDYLFTRPIFSIRQISDELKIPFKTASSYLSKLEQKAVIEEITGQSRNRIYRANAILSNL